MSDNQPTLGRKIVDGLTELADVLSRDGWDGVEREFRVTRFCGRCGKAIDPDSGSCGCRVRAEPNDTTGDPG